MSSFDYDFVRLCWTLFRVLVLGLLPICAIVVLAIYLKRILTALGEKRSILGKARARATRTLKRF